jgi:hypothetical protein
MIFMVLVLKIEAFGFLSKIAAKELEEGLALAAFLDGFLFLESGLAAL